MSDWVFEHPEWLQGLWGLPLLVILSVAMVTAHRPELGAFITDPGTFIAAAPVPFIAALIALLGFGPGRWSVDAVLAPSGEDDQRGG